MTTSGVDPALFRQLLGRFATGVSVVTARRADGARVGMTASSIDFPARNSDTTGCMS